ncbi:MAG: cysteine desulfurase [Deltaproteobacteria bacterium]|nr:cysteine desulfurase [Deltaproteobacteria bacterium]
MIYLDYNGTTAVDPRVREAMLPYLGELYGNPSSSHWAGRQVQPALARAREQVAALVGGEPEEIVFTAGGSESDNLALKGLLLGRWADRLSQVHVVTSAVEHPAVYQTCRYLESLGVRVTYLEVDRQGRLTAAQVAAVLTEQTVLVSLMLANNETGVVFPLAEIAALTRERGILLHTDAVQAVGKVPLDVHELGIDLLAISGHKFYAPKGIGALWVRSGVELEPLVHGGGQEGGRRSGTEAVAAAVALGQAAELVLAGQEEESRRVAGLRDRLEEQLLAAVPGIEFHGRSAPRVPNTSNFSVSGVDGESLRLHLDLRGFAVSAGSACASGSGKGSRVLLAMGVPPGIAQSSLRVSIGRWTTAAEIDAFVAALAAVTADLRRISPHKIAS